MDHPYKKIFLSGIGEEFDVSFPAMMADHSKTCDLIGSIGICIYLDKAPVHLIGFPRGSLISASPVSLRGNELTLGRNKIPVIRRYKFLRLLTHRYIQLPAAAQSIRKNS